MLDFNSAARRTKDTLGENADALSSLWHKKQLEYTWLRSLMGAYAPFWQFTGEALDYAMDTLAIADDELRQRLMQLYLTLDPTSSSMLFCRLMKSKSISTTRPSTSLLLTGSASPRSLSVIELLGCRWRFAFRIQGRVVQSLRSAV
ncbi:hypothetical protein [Phyllobacterium bourgognense]|uniref:hypothetical protein n=1 Tax=Phyllobacterium bourgognense TaxID=314236 RepID=UPI001FDFD9A8|nr:hypothetical protein [Phyllobacterium bourgognense]